MYEKQLEEYGFVPMNHAKPNFVKAGVSKLYTYNAAAADNPIEVDGHVAITNEKGKVLAVHGKGYNFIDHNDLFAEFDDKIGPLSSNVLVHSDSSHDGCRVFREYVFEDHKVKLGDRDIAPRMMMSI